MATTEKLETAEAVSYAKRRLQPDPDDKIEGNGYGKKKTQRIREDY